MNTDQGIALALHGGAGARAGLDYSQEVAHMRGVVEIARERLLAGAPALEVAVETVEALEASGLYVAGRGASPNRRGDYELDACVMDGQTRMAGSVAALQGFQSPVRAALAVLQRTPHVMLAGVGAADFARDQGLEPVVDPAEWFTRARYTPDEDDLAHGTVGCVVRDRAGQLAAATSTAGVFGKMPGRLGDSPVPGAGAWADGTVAVSCTGQGEYFLRVAAAAQLAFRLRFGGQGLAEAGRAILEEIRALGGDGGLIAVNAKGQVITPFITDGMKRAVLYPDGRIVSEVFAPAEDISPGLQA